MNVAIHVLIASEVLASGLQNLCIQASQPFPAVKEFRERGGVDMQPDTPLVWLALTFSYNPHLAQDFRTACGTTNGVPGVRPVKFRHKRHCNLAHLRYLDHVRACTAERRPLHTSTIDSPVSKHTGGSACDRSTTHLLLIMSAPMMCLCNHTSRARGRPVGRGAG